MAVSTTTLSATTLPVECGVSTQMLGGESELGDAHVIVPYEGGVLVAVIDGLGHGAEAAQAAKMAVSILEDHAGLPLIELVNLCHKELRKTRGAVLSIASFDISRDSLTWIGVGNVEGALFRADGSAVPAKESLLLRGGVVGYQLPPLRTATIPIFPGDVLVFVTDGIQGSFHEEALLGLDPQEAADTIMFGYGKYTDDALVLVARYVGSHT